MKSLAHSSLVVIWALFSACQTGGSADAPTPQAGASKIWKEKNPVWRGVHFMVNGDRQVTTLQEQLPKLAAIGVNALVLEVNYNFEFKSHPELSSANGVKQAHARELA